MKRITQARRDEWCGQLRSGLYKQGRGQLRDGDAFCCLAVLCDCATEPGSGWDGDAFVFDKRRFIGGAPDELGLSPEQQFRLATLNDAGKTFPEIADYIEQNIPVED